MDGRGHSSELVADYNVDPASTSDDCDLSTPRSTGGFRGGSAELFDGDNPDVFHDENSGSPRALEDGRSRAAMLSPVSATRSTMRPTTQQLPQYYRDEAKRPPVRDTMMSGVSGVTGSSGLTGSSGRTAGSGTPMLPGIPKSAFEEDTPKPKRKLILCGIKKSNSFVLLVLLIFLLVAAVAIGVGVGMSSTSGASPYSKQTNTTHARYHSRI